jgi:hypothetical protein
LALPALCCHTDPVFYPRTAAEVLALDILHRSGWRPVAQDAVQQWFDDRSRHVGTCSCWRCQAAATVGPDRVWRCLLAWRLTTTRAPMPGPIVPRRPQPRWSRDAALVKQARALRESGLTMRAIGVELGCSAATVYKCVRNG